MKKMNLPNSSPKEIEHQEQTTERNDAYLIVDGEAWDVSNLLNSLPSDESTRKFERLGRSRSSSSLSNRKKSPYFSRDGDEHQEEVRKLPALLKKAHNENLTLKPVPKYDWRSRTKSPPPSPATSPSNDEHHHYTSSQRRSRSPEEPSHNGQKKEKQDQLREQQQSQDDDDFERSLIEVFPGFEMALRGSVETQAAIARDYIIKANCMDCTLQLQCIRNAEYILCPLCHCVSPLVLSCSKVEPGAFGVGLGFVEEEL